MLNHCEAQLEVDFFSCLAIVQAYETATYGEQPQLSEQNSLNPNNLFKSRACPGWKLQIIDK